MKPEDFPVRAPDAHTVDFGDEVVIYQRQTGEVHRLDSIGAVVWRCLDGQTTFDELVGDLSRAFDADATVVRNDVAVLLGRLGHEFLLAGGPPSTPARGPRLVTNPPSP